MHIAHTALFALLSFPGVTHVGSPASERPWSECERAFVDVVRKWHEADQFDGVVLVARGEDVWVGAAGDAVREWAVPNDEETRFPIASMTKQFTAVLVMRRVETGRLELDGTISTYLPWYREDTGSRVTVRDLLSHTSGLPDTPTALYLDPEASEKDSRWVVETHCSGDLEFEPGTRFSYTNTDYHVLGAILEEVTGSSFETLLREDILEPLGMRDTGIARRDEIQPRRAQDYVPSEDGWLHAPAFRWENWQAAGGMVSTVGDLLKWDRALSRGSLLEERTWELMLQPRTDLPGTGNYVGLGSWVYPRRLPKSGATPTLIERRGAIGGYTTLNVLERETGWCVIVLANAYTEQIHRLPWGESMPLDLFEVLHGE